MVLPTEALKTRVAAYQKAMEEATKAVADAAANAAANAAIEAVPEGPGGLGEPVVIELDEGASAAFEETIKVEDYESSYIEAL